MRSLNRKRPGFTLIEVLVAILIISLLVFIILPAVQSARENARKTQCINHLKQINAAILNFESTNRYLPTLCTGMFSGVGERNGALSIHYQILPFIEQKNLYDSINCPGNDFPQVIVFNVPNNRTALNTQIETFLCPSDRHFKVSNNNYRGNLGSKPFEIEGSTGIASQGGGGPFKFIYKTTISDIKDGLSNTAGISERLVGNGDLNSFDPKRDLWFTGIGSNDPIVTADILLKVCAIEVANPYRYHARFGEYWLSGYRSHTVYDHVLPPNAKFSDCTSDIFMHSPESFTSAGISARSHHYGGVNSGFMDGSVRFVKDSISLEVWRAMGTRNGTEAIDEF